MREINRRGRAAPIDQRQPAGVTVSQYARAVFDQWQSNFGDPFAAIDIFSGDDFGLGDGCGACDFHGLFRIGPRQDTIQRVLQVGSRGARVQQRVVRLGNVTRKAAVRRFKKSLRQPVRRGCADGAGAADDHRRDGVGCLPMILQAQQSEPMRQQRLVDHHHVATFHPNGTVIFSANFHESDSLYFAATPGGGLRARGRRSLHRLSRANCRPKDRGRCA